MGIGASKTQQQPEGKPRFWFRDGYFLTNDKSYLDPKVVNEAFASDLMWWNESVAPAQMRKMLDNCLTMGVYAVPGTTEEHMKQHGAPAPRSGGAKPRMVAFARVVTDYVSFAYLTDVFVLPDAQRQGLASWMMRAIKEMVDEWPDLRGLMLMTHDKAAARMYERTLGAVDFDKGPSAGLTMLEMAGRAEKEIPKNH